MVHISDLNEIIIAIFFLDWYVPEGIWETTDSKSHVDGKKLYCEIELEKKSIPKSLGEKLLIMISYSVMWWATLSMLGVCHVDNEGLQCVVVGLLRCASLLFYVWYPFFLRFSLSSSLRTVRANPLHSLITSPAHAESSKSVPRLSRINASFPGWGGLPQLVFYWNGIPRIS